MADAGHIVTTDGSISSQLSSRGKSRIPVFNNNLNNSLQTNKSGSDDLTYDQNDNLPNYTDKWKFQLVNYLIHKAFLFSLNRNSCSIDDH